MKIILSGDEVEEILQEWAMRVHGLSCDVHFDAGYNTLREAHLTNNARAAEKEITEPKTCADEEDNTPL